MSYLERETLREESERMARKRFLGMMLMAAGGLLALLCGLCTLVMSASAIGGGAEASAMLMIVLPIGVTLFWIGLRMYREGRKRRGHPERTFD
jgi:hypothetical protein